VIVWADWLRAEISGLWNRRRFPTIADRRLTGAVGHSDADFGPFHSGAPSAEWNAL